MEWQRRGRRSAFRKNRGQKRLKVVQKVTKLTVNLLNSKTVKGHHQGQTNTGQGHQSCSTKSCMNERDRLNNER